MWTDCLFVHAKISRFYCSQQKLSSLYGADLTSSLSKHGESQVIKISVSGLDDRYSLDDVSIAKELSELLCSVIFEPNVKNNAFIESELEQERRQLLDVIDSEFNEKRIYAMGQLIKHMCKDEVFGIKRYGTAEKSRPQLPNHSARHGRIFSKPQNLRFSI